MVTPKRAPARAHAMNLWTRGALCRRANPTRLHPCASLSDLADVDCRLCRRALLEFQDELAAALAVLGEDVLDQMVAAAKKTAWEAAEEAGPEPEPDEQ